jgi:hypothetical protein
MDHLSKKKCVVVTMRNNLKNLGTQVMLIAGNFKKYTCSVGPSL